ncbi:unnamed protein product [Amoebophrya sp. A25]|nr:unnamed protein product [Amoebophrya sp. A25]|eukprot:GSA25T00025154001.1
MRDVGSLVVAVRPTAWTMAKVIEDHLQQSNSWNKHAVGEKFPMPEMENEQVKHDRDPKKSGPVARAFKCAWAHKWRRRDFSPSSEDLDGQYEEEIRALMKRKAKWYKMLVAVHVPLEVLEGKALPPQMRQGLYSRKEDGDEDIADMQGSPLKRRRTDGKEEHDSQVTMGSHDEQQCDSLDGGAKIEGQRHDADNSSRASINMGRPTGKEFRLARTLVVEWLNERVFGQIVTIPLTQMTWKIPRIPSMRQVCPYGFAHLLEKFATSSSSDEAERKKTKDYLEKLKTFREWDCETATTEFASDENVKIFVPEPSRTQGEVKDPVFYVLLSATTGRHDSWADLTGKRHQLRAHIAALAVVDGLSACLVGDNLYRTAGMDATARTAFLLRSSNYQRSEKPF